MQFLPVSPKHYKVLLLIDYGSNQSFILLVRPKAPVLF
jgi:hypothetical protein